MSRTLLPAVIEFLEEIVHVVEVGPHLRSFRPALAHDIYRFRWRGALADRWPDQGRRLHHFLDYICEVRSRDTRLNLIWHAISIGDVDRHSRRDFCENFSHDRLRITRGASHC